MHNELHWFHASLNIIGGDQIGKVEMGGSFCMNRVKKKYIQ